MAWLTEAGFLVSVVSTFAAAKAQMRDDPSLLISEVRLGAYNGLHLGIYAKARGIPTIVVGDRDADLEREAEGLGVVYLPRELTRSAVLSATSNLVLEHTDTSAQLADAPNVADAFLTWSDLRSMAGARTDTPAHGRRGPLPS